MNKSAILYINLPVTVFLFIFANVSIYIIFEPNILPIQHIGPAVCVPVVTIYLGLYFIYNIKKEENENVRTF